MEDKRRIQGSEQEGIYDLYALVHELENIQKRLPRRLAEIPGGTRLVKEMNTKAEHLLTKVLETMPLWQLEQFRRNLDSLRITIGVARVDNTKNQEKYGRWMSLRALTGLMDAAHDYCTLCEKDFDQQCKCDMRRAMDELPVDTPEDVKGCPYYAAWVRF